MCSFSSIKKSFAITDNAKMNFLEHVLLCSYKNFGMGIARERAVHLYFHQVKFHSKRIAQLNSYQQ